MTRKGTRRKLLAWVLAGALVGSAALVAACAPKANPGIPVPVAEKAAQTPEPDSHGVVKAEQWKDIYPHQYASYLQNATNGPLAEEYTADIAAEDATSAKPEGFTYEGGQEKADYLADDQYPEIKTLGLGYGYSKYYTEPASHVYSLWTVTHNGRVNENTKAGCIACKTPQFSNDVDEQGDGIFKKSFWDLVTTYDENISCASCHGNDPTQLEVDRKDWKRAMGDDAQTASLNGQICGQCHCDYSMDPKTGVPTSPYYGGLKSMVPDEALKWYDEHDYVDWVYESTGAKMLAVRHAEYEFNYGGEGNHMTNMGYDCNDCHMGTKFADDGTAYTNHEWTNPTDNDELIEQDCSKCHEDLKAQVKAWQDELDGRTHQIGLRAEKFIHNFEDALEAKTVSDKDKTRLQKIQRDACYYWNLVAAENSEGAHNPALYTETLDKAEKLLDEADGILGTSSAVS